MGQVPKYLIVGDGRLARHFQFYLSSLSISYLSWHRGHSEAKLRDFLASQNIVLLLISDDALSHFVKNYNLAARPGVVHCSATVHIDGVHFSHPLMTFGTDLYKHSVYPTVPFGIAEDGPPLSELLPGLPNPSFVLSEANRVLYHTLCVVGGNFSAMLWQQFFDGMQTSMGIDRKYLLPFMKQVSSNVMNGGDALTGPLVRGDQGTIKKHLEALGDGPLGEVYRAMINVYEESQHETA